MRLYLATGNAHKIGEFSAILTARGVQVEVMAPSAAGGMPQVDEDAGTFIGNARKKAAALAAQIRAGGGVADAPWCAVGDDSGLCVDALDGAPGVRSARFAGDGAGDAANTAKLLRLLEGVRADRRTAAFHCAIVAILADGRELSSEGRCPGRIIRAPAGGGGFGYDPVFVPEGHERTFAELPADVKNAISHRARALEVFAAMLSETMGGAR